MQRLLILALAIAAASAFPQPIEKLDHHHTGTEDVKCTKRWEQFKSEYGLVINGPEEESHRLDVFCKTLSLIKKHNEHEDATFRMDVNQFAAILPNEVLKFTGYLGSKTSAEKLAVAKQFTRHDNFDMPKKFDWREKGIVTPVQEQGKCGSCWAFSAAGALASHYYLQKKNMTLLEFSEQELIDCSTKFGNTGCDGGLMSNAFDYVKESGIETSRDYPYEGKDANCRQTKEKLITRDSGFFAIPTGNEDALREAVARVGPVSVAITVTNSFFNYKSGVFYDAHCDGQELNHGVLLVGFGTDSKYGDYWLIKNSWGEQWGEQGYIRMARGKGKACGIAKEAVFPVIV